MVSQFAHNELTTALPEQVQVQIVQDHELDDFLPERDCGA